jgi:hypothetical protein
MNSKEPSLLSHINDLRKKHEEDGISIIILCASYPSDSDISLILQAQRKIVEEELNCCSELNFCSEVNFTGILMAQEKSVLHMLEGPSQSILRILVSLSKQNQFGRVVLALEDCNKRNFPEWYSCIVQEIQSSSYDTDISTNPNVITDLTKGLFEVGRKLQKESAEEVELNKYVYNAYYILPIYSLQYLLQIC